MADVAHRTVTEDQFDGSTGEKVESKVVHQLGAVIEGVFVPFISKEGSYVERLVADEQARQQAAQPAPDSSAQAPAEQTAGV